MIDSKLGLQGAQHIKLMADRIKPAAPRHALRPVVTVDRVWVQRMLEPLRERDPAVVAAALAQTGVPALLLEQANGRITGEQYATLLRLLMALGRDESLGFLSRPLKPGSFALLAEHATGARNLGQAMRRSARVLTLLQDDFTIRLAHQAGLVGFVLEFLNPVVASRSFFHDLLLRVMWQFYAWLAGDHLPVRRFDLAYAQPPQPQSYRQVFSHPIAFDARHSAVWFDTAQLATPVRRDSDAVRKYLARALDHIILPRRFDATVSDQIRSHLRHAQPNWPDLAQLAAVLHVSTATLQRRLAAEGTSFRDLSHELRRDLAITELTSSGIPIKVLARQLGFETTGSFQRAFRRWTGRTPMSYRQTWSQPQDGA